ncbi:MAG: hypothetical protein WCP34_07745 [Pseudomonadota bacterium]
MITYFFLSVMTLVWVAMFILPVAAYVALAVRLAKSAFSSQDSEPSKGFRHHEPALLLVASS